MKIEELIKITKTFTVLYAEDEKEVREHTLRFFKHFFSDITVTINGKEAWEAFQKNEYDLVIADLQMPIMSGNELINNIRAVSLDTYIIAMSGISGENGVQYSANVKIQKPVNLDIFEQALEKMIQSKK